MQNTLRLIQSRQSFLGTALHRLAVLSTTMHLVSKDFWRDYTTLIRLSTVSFAATPVSNSNAFKPLLRGRFHRLAIDAAKLPQPVVVPAAWSCPALQRTISNPLLYTQQ